MSYLKMNLKKSISDIYINFTDVGNGLKAFSKNYTNLELDSKILNLFLKTRI